MNTPSKEPEDSFDCIVIGSGMGGLTVASLLAQVEGWKVLVLERHFKIGGFTHTFKRRRWEWDVGLHYVGQMEEESFPRQVFDLATQGSVQWHKIPDPFDTFNFPEFLFKQFSGQKRFQTDLKECFPNEHKAIDTYFRDVRRVTQWSGWDQLQKTFPKPLQSLTRLVWGGRRHTALTTLADYFRQIQISEPLAAVLAGFWADYGLPPSQASFYIHALIAQHYFEGGYYPVGGAGVIGDSIKQVVEQFGGKLLVNQEVIEILQEGNRAVGVRVCKTRSPRTSVREYLAPCIISNAGALATYLKLLPSSVDVPFRNELDVFPKGVGHICLYLGFRESPKNLGLHGGNLWFFDSSNHDFLFDQQDKLLQEQAKFAYLSFPSLKDPEHKGPHTGEIIVSVSYEAFQRWKEQPWKKRGSDYETLKETISRTLISFVDSHIPGFRDLVEFSELSTPLSTEYFTGHTGGAIYGIPATPERYALDCLGGYTPLKGLYQTGADAHGHGIIGALMSGFMTACAVVGWTGLFKIGRAVKKFQKELVNKERKKLLSFANG